MSEKKVRRKNAPREPRTDAGAQIELLEAVEGSVTLSEKRARLESRWGEWLDAYRRGGWSEAATATGVTDREASAWMARYPEFRAAFDECREATAQRLERIADAIASGETAGTPSQVQMLQFRLRGLKPETYRERASVTLDQRLLVGGTGDGSRARMLLAEWGGSATDAAATVAARMLGGTDGGGA